jgi:hypothetical protein
LPFTDFLKSTVLLTAGEATALGAVTIVAASAKGDVVTIIFSLAWWAIAGIIGAVIGRTKRPTENISNLLAEAEPLRGLPQIRPAAVLVNRLWPLGVAAVGAAGISWLYPQVASVATGYAIFVALAWRKQEPAVSAIEGRDGVRYYVIAESPIKRMRLARTPGYRHAVENGAGPA